MTRSDFGPFSAMLTTEATAYPQSAAMNGDRIGLYFESLDRFSLDQIKQALKTIRAKAKFFPTVAEIIEALESSATDKAEIAWRTFLNATAEGEWYSAYVYDKGIAYAIDVMGGWMDAVNAVRTTSPEMLASFEKRFKASYRLATDRPALAKKNYFLGMTETTNRQNVGQLAAWTRGAKKLGQKVVVITTHKHGVLEMPVDLATMGLSESAQKDLAAGGQALKNYLPAPAPERKMLPESTDAEPITKSEQRAILAQVRAIGGGSVEMFGSLKEGEE